MTKIKFGLQTYCWQMSYEKYRGKISQIAAVGTRAGFNGMEAEVCMLDTLFPDSGKVKEIMEENQMHFAALALPLNWLNNKETDEERNLADKAIQFVKEMGDDCKLILAHLPQKDRADLQQRQKNQISCICEVAKRAADAGVCAAFHANSSFGSAFRTREDYAILLNGIANAPLGFAPDAGHISHGGMNALEIIREYREKVIHVHFKDMSEDEKWCPMGEGIIDFPGIVSYLNETGYDGWIMVEEESAGAVDHPDSIMESNGLYMQKLKNSVQ